MQTIEQKQNGAVNFQSTSFEMIGSADCFQIRESLDALCFYPAETDGEWHELRIGLRSVKGSKGFGLTYRQGYQGSLQRN
jgi:hypothetical protein